MTPPLGNGPFRQLSAESVAKLRGPSPVAVMLKALAQEVGPVTDADAESIEQFFETLKQERGQQP